MKRKNKKLDKKILSFFLIAFPTVLIIAFGALNPYSTWSQILLAIYQFILLKQYLDNYYNALG